MWCFKIVYAICLAVMLFPLSHAMSDSACPNPKGLQIADTELQARLQAHKEWVEKGGYLHPETPGRAIFCNLDLRNANLAGSELSWANLAGADLLRANLVKARLEDADLTSASLYQANLAGADLSGAQLSGAVLAAADLTKADLLKANFAKAVLQDALLIKADLDRANLTDTDMVHVKMMGANLSGATLVGARLGSADMTEVNLSQTNLTGADLRHVNLTASRFEQADLKNAKLSGATLTGAQYETVSAPDQGYLSGLEGITTLHFRKGEGSGLVQLRALLATVGLRDLERQATYAIEHQNTIHKFSENRVEALFRLVLFEWTTGYGLRPGRALLVLLAFIGVFTLVYMVPITSNRGGIYRVWSKERLEEVAGKVHLIAEAKVDQVHARGGAALLYAFWFSVLFAFHIGWRELTVGSWLARLQTHEYVLKATGWVRFLSGLQSLISVYLLAMWALTYFGRPFQ
jgi:uncharacterized protein YjbI with pentapeptide repeats